MVRDIRYIFKRVLIGLLIALGVIFFKSKGVFAATTQLNSNVRVYAKSGNCTYNSSTTDFNCVQGPSYKFVGENITSSKATETDIPTIPFIVNNMDSDVLIQNAIYDIELATPLTISSSERSVYLKFGGPYPRGNGVYGSSTTGSTGYLFRYTQFSATPLDTTNDSNKVLKLTYGFKPYYCSYHNPDTDTTSTCNLILDIGNDNWFKIIVNLPIGTKLDRFTIYFGAPNLVSSIGSKTLNNVIVPDNPTFISGANSDISYDLWRKDNSTRIGLQYFKAGVSLSSPQLQSPVAQFVRVDSNNYTSNTYQWNYSNLSNELVAQYQATIPEIEEELTPTSDNDTFFSDFLEGFTTSSQASGFISLFNNMFLYPLQKLRDNSQVDLVRDNIYGDKILSNYLCMQNSEPGLLGSYVPYKVQFFRDYKFTLPCPHTEIYNKLYYGEYGFYGNNFKGAEIRTGISYSFAEIWLTLQHGFLVYILFVNCLNVYKYVLDSNKTEVEVLEL